MESEITVSLTSGGVPVTVLHPKGDLDASNYRDIIAQARQVVAQGSRRMVVDLGGVCYMSSSGLVALQSIAAMLRGEEGPDLEAGWEAIHQIGREREGGFQPHFKLANPQPRVDRVLETVGFKRYLETFADLESAVASFQ